MFGLLHASDSSRLPPQARRHRPIAPAPKPAVTTTSQMTRRASSRHSPLREPPGLSYVRHHPYPGIQRRTSISQLHRLPSPSPPQPSGSRRASHDPRLSPARSGEVPMSGGSAFGQINLLADVAASQATTASLDRGTMRTHGGPATRRASAARRDESGQGNMVAIERGRRDTVADVSAP